MALPPPLSGSSTLAFGSSRAFEPLTLLEHAPIAAYLLRAAGDDLVLEGVNAAARAKTPALGAMIGHPISLLYADEPQMLADAQRCHRERTRVVRETSERRHGSVDGAHQTLVFTSLDAECIVIYAQETRDVESATAELNEVQECYRSLLALGGLVKKIERLLRRLVGPTIDLLIETSDPSGAGLWVRADPAQLEQVLVNLVINARDAMPGGGSVNLKVGTQTDTPPGEWVVLEVRDQGRGIESDHLAHVFDPFFTTKKTGTGLGLASSYGVVQTHGGTITVESEPGRGACFKVSLPRVTAELGKAAPPGRTAPGRGRVLVVDDDAAVRTGTTRMLQTLGYEVLTAADGAEAEALVKRGEVEFDLLVCDLAMPNRSGPEVARSIRHICPNIKVLFVSGYPRGADRELPAESFLQKPYDRDALARKLAALSPMP